MRIPKQWACHSSNGMGSVEYCRETARKTATHEYTMIPRVVDVKPLDGYRLWLRFQEGLCGIVDVSADFALEFLCRAAEKSGEA